jgi:hypothetical protein
MCAITVQNLSFKPNLDAEKEKKDKLQGARFVLGVKWTW